MNQKLLHLLLAALPAAWLFGGLARADEHTEMALKHAKEVIESVGDSKAMAQHATEALKHIEEAKAANYSNPKMLKRLEKSEVDLRAAIDKANRYHGATAVQNAKDAKANLEAAHK